MTNGVKISVLLLAAVVCGGGFLFGSAYLKSRALEQDARARQLRLETAAAARAAAEAEAKAKASEEKKEEHARKRAEADRDAVRAATEKAKQEAANLAERKAVAKQEEAAKAKAAAAAQAEEKRLVAEKAAAEAKKAEQEARRAAEAVARDKAAEERRTAEAEAARTAAARKIAADALAKSENDRKAAEANAAAEHDRKLRMYRRAETSRAEMLELQRAERMLALEEAGVDVAAVMSAARENGGADGAAEDDGGGAAAQPAVAVAWPDADGVKPPDDVALFEADAAAREQAKAAHDRRAGDYMRTFGEIIDRARAEGRAADADHYSRLLLTLVPDYDTRFADMADDARRAGRDDEATACCRRLMEHVPAWKRVGTVATLLDRDEAYYGRTLAGLVPKDVYVRAFRRRYDEARRNISDRDDREAAMARICAVLAARVPDYERNPEWK